MSVPSKSCDLETISEYSTSIATELSKKDDNTGGIFKGWDNINARDSTTNNIAKFSKQTTTKENNFQDTSIPMTTKLYNNTSNPIIYKNNTEIKKFTKTNKNTMDTNIKKYPQYRIVQKKESSDTIDFKDSTNFSNKPLKTKGNASEFNTKPQVLGPENTITLIDKTKKDTNKSLILGDEASTTITNKHNDHRNEINFNKSNS